MQLCLGLRGDKVLIFVLSDCLSGLLQPSDLSSLSDGRSIACPIRMSLNIYICYIIFYHLYLYVLRVSTFYDLSAWGGCWFVVYIRMFIYKFLNVCPFDHTAVAGRWKVGPVNQVNHISWVAVVTFVFQLTVLSRSAAAVLSNFFVALCCHFALLTFLLV